MSDSEFVWFLLRAVVDHILGCFHGIVFVSMITFSIAIRTDHPKNWVGFLPSVLIGLTGKLAFVIGAAIAFDAIFEQLMADDDDDDCDDSDEPDNDSPVANDYIRSFAE